MYSFSHDFCTPRHLSKSSVADSVVWSFIATYFSRMDNCSRFILLTRKFANEFGFQYNGQIVVPALGVIRPLHSVELE